MVAAFAAARRHIDSRLNVGVTSDAALAALRPELIRQGFVDRALALVGAVCSTIVAYEAIRYHIDRVGVRHPELAA